MLPAAGLYAGAMTSTLLVIVLSVIVPLGITAVILWGVWTKVLGPLRAQQREQQQLLRIGVSCAARVLQYQETGMKVSMGAQDSYSLKLLLEVMPPGMPPYQVETVALVSVLAAPRIQPGCIVTVRYDPSNPRRVAMETAYPPGQGPAAAPPLGGYPPPGAYGAPAGAPPGAHGAYPGGPPGAAYGA
ncbi:hypothetical protein BE15_17460, partial [Sorangium cellulosum]